jgi:hypothetical protein
MISVEARGVATVQNCIRTGRRRFEAATPCNVGRKVKEFRLIYSQSGKNICRFHVSSVKAPFK